jgi:hypothetical protein
MAGMGLVLQGVDDKHVETAKPLGSFLRKVTDIGAIGDPADAET